MRRRLPVAIVLLLGGLVWAAAHWGAHRAVVGGSGGHAGMGGAHEQHAAVGGGYLSTSFALCLSLALVLAAGATLRRRPRSGLGPSLWLFGAVPLLGLLAEPLIASPATSTAFAALAPLVLVAALFQLAVALVAVRLAQGLLGLAEAVARTFASAPLAVARPGIRRTLRRRAELVRAFSPASGGGPRAPPAGLAA